MLKSLAAQDWHGLLGMVQAVMRACIPDGKGKLLGDAGLGDATTVSKHAVHCALVCTATSLGQPIWQRGRDGS